MDSFASGSGKVEGPQGNGSFVHKETVPDVDLLQAIAKQDKRALSTFYDRHAARLYGLALKILKDETLAQGVVQDLFLFLWQKAHVFTQERGAPVTWVLILCRNRCIDKLRYQRTRQRYTVRLQEAMRAFPTSASENPLELLMQKQLLAVVSDALATLPEEQRTVIEKAYLRGFTQSQLARSMNLPLGTVKTRLRLGMQKLRRSVDSRENEKPDPRNYLASVP